MPKSKRISDVDKQRLYDSFLRGEDYLLLSRQMKNNLKSAHSIKRTMKRRNGVASLPSCGCYNYKVDAEMKNEIERIVEDYPSMSRAYF